MQYTGVQGVVVLGGMYNPPLPVHRTLLLEAMRAVGAEKGIFAMEPYSRVFHTLSRHTAHARVLPDAIRRKQLEKLCGGDARLSIESLYSTKKENQKCFEGIQSQYPDAKIYILIRSQTLRLLPSWLEETEYEKNIYLVLADECETPEEIIARKPILSKHRENFRVLRSEEWKQNKGESVNTLCINAVEENTLVDFENDEYAMLSNFYEAPIVWEGLQYRNLEAAYQAQKTLDMQERRSFQKISGLKARSRGLRCMTRPNWENIRLSVMLDLVRAKFAQNPELVPYLLETGDTALLMRNRWNDTFWGISTRTGRGANHLGEILMEVRQELREKDCAAH